ncbi:hypothetical protein D3C87_1232790 [compost metagenome]
MHQPFQAIDRHVVQLDTIFTEGQVAEMIHLTEHLWNGGQQVVLQVEVTQPAKRSEKRQMLVTQFAAAQAQVGDMVEIRLEFRQRLKQPMDQGKIVEFQPLRTHRTRPLYALGSGALPALPDRLAEALAGTQFGNPRRR